MRPVSALAVALVLFSSVPAKSQDALATFAFMFVDDKIDVTRDYGTELVAPWVPPFTRIVTVTDNCVFEVATFRLGLSEYQPQKQLMRLERWNFNKAFFDEAKDTGPGLAGRHIIIPGENGLKHVSEYCKNDYFEGCQNTPMSEKDDEVVILSYLLNERRVKALHYFVENFCHGIKRKSAF